MKPYSTTGFVALEVRIICPKVSYRCRLIQWLRGRIVRLSRKVKIVVTMIGTRFRSALALASRSTPKLCSVHRLAHRSNLGIKAGKKKKRKKEKKEKRTYHQRSHNNFHTVEPGAQTHQSGSSRASISDLQEVGSSPGRASFYQRCCVVPGSHY